MQRLRNLVSLKKTLRNSQINSVPYVQFSNNNLDPKNKFRDTKNYDEQEKLMTPDEIKENRERASKIIWGFASKNSYMH